VPQLDLKRLTFLLRLGWWGDAFVSAVAFAPRCLVPSLALATANIAVFTGIRALAAVLAGGEVTMEELSRATTAGCLSALTGLILMAWGFSAWILRLTAFARACLGHERPPSSRVFVESLAQVRKRRGYLTVLWLVASAYLLIPVGLLCLVILADSFSSAFPALEMPAAMHAVLQVMGFAVAVLAMAYTFAVLIASSVSTAGPGATAWHGAQLSIRRWCPVVVVTAAVLGLNALLLLPASPGQGSSVESMLKQDMTAYVAGQLWFGIISAVAWPLSLMPFCDILREDLEH